MPRRVDAGCGRIAVEGLRSQKTEAIPVELSVLCWRVFGEKRRFIGPSNSPITETRGPIIAAFLIGNRGLFRENRVFMLEDEGAGVARCHITFQAIGRKKKAGATLLGLCHLVALFPR